MKKFALIFILFALFSCDKEEVKPEPDFSDDNTVYIAFDINGEGAYTFSYTIDADTSTFSIDTYKSKQGNGSDVRFLPIDNKFVSNHTGDTVSIAASLSFESGRILQKKDRFIIGINKRSDTYNNRIIAEDFYFYF